MFKIYMSRINHEKLKILSFLFYLLTLTLVGIYFATVNLLFREDEVDKEFPILRARFGTILSHSDAVQNYRQNIDLTDKEFHTYCYYPGESVSYTGKSGEYFIKRVDKIEDCTGWNGVAQFREGYWVSEREKIWWSYEQKQSVINSQVASGNEQKQNTN